MVGMYQLIISNISDEKPWDWSSISQEKKSFP